ncbi:MAG: hypothetical protein FJ109_12120 [Deltaproteobacteria bacterium]|nr:hypothetical protein [Deltaproteobacteria bacterium]
MQRLVGILRRLFLENLGIKLLALVLAVALALAAREETIQELDIEVPLAMGVHPTDQVLLTDLPASVRVRVRGDIQHIAEALSNREPFLIDVADEGDNQTIYLSPEVLESHLGGGLDVLSVSPGNLSVRFDRLEVRQVPVRVEIVRRPQNYWSIDEERVAVEPSLVEARGPSAVVQGLVHLRTEALDLAGLTSDFTGKVGLEAPAGLEVRPGAVQVFIPVREREGDKLLKGVRILLRNCPKGYDCRATPTFFQARVDGKQRLVDQITMENLGQYVYIDVRRLPLDKGVVQKHFPAVEPTVEALNGVRFTLTGAKYFNVTVTRR